MKNIAFLLICFILIPNHAIGQQKVPNLGDKSCVLWIDIAEKSKSDIGWKEAVVQMDWWSMGYLKGMATQYSYISKETNPLLKLRNNEEIEWMRSFCRVNRKASISDAAAAFLDELNSRP